MARQKAVQVVEKLRGLRLTKAADIVETAVEETLAYYAFHSFAGAVKAGRVCGHYWLGLDRPKHGGTLARTGLHASPAWNLPSVATMVVERGRPRGEAWRVGCKRHRTARSCLAELRRPRADFWPARPPLCHEALVTALRLFGNQHLTVSQRFDVVGIGWSTPAALLLRMSGLKLRRAGLVGDQRWAGPLTILALRQQMPAEHRELASHGHRGDLMAAPGADAHEESMQRPGALADAQAASTNIARA